MDITIKEIIEDEGKFEKNVEIVKNFLKNRFENLSKTKTKRKNLNSNVNIGTNFKPKLNMVAMIYRNMFGDPENGEWDEKKIKIIEDLLRKIKK